MPTVASMMFIIQVRRPRLSSWSGVTLSLLLAQGCASASSVKNEMALAPVAPDSVKSPAKATVVPLGNIGSASWYGPGFNGKKTASGDIFDESKFTAAHKTLPLGTRARVTNLNNGKSVSVQINDRGPYAGDRIIDLSKAAARALEMIDHGVIDVIVEPLFDEPRFEAGRID